MLQSANLITDKERFNITKRLCKSLTPHPYIPNAYLKPTINTKPYMVTVDDYLVPYYLKLETLPTELRRKHLLMYPSPLYKVYFHEDEFYISSHKELLFLNESFQLIFDTTDYFVAKKYKLTIKLPLYGKLNLYKLV